MTTKHLSSLIIDASLAQAAGGEDAVHPTSRNCREFLMTVDKAGFRLVMTASILAEWKKHESHFSMRWRLKMVATKRMVSLRVVEDEPLRQKVIEFSASSRKAAIVLKDCHLVEAAIVTQRPITSLDDVVRNGLRNLAEKVLELKRICWVNPNCEAETAIEWLKQGAPLERLQLLGFSPK